MGEINNLRPDTFLVKPVIEQSQNRRVLLDGVVMISAAGAPYVIELPDEFIANIQTSDE